MTDKFFNILTNLRRVLALGAVDGHVLRAALDLHLELPPHLEEARGISALSVKHVSYPKFGMITQYLHFSRGKVGV